MQAVALTTSTDFYSCVVFLLGKFVGGAVGTAYASVLSQWAVGSLVGLGMMAFCKVEVV